MTKRAIFLGLLGSIAICGLTYLNDQILRQTYLVGNNLPVSVFGTLIIFLLVNALIFRFRSRLALSGQELAIILAMTLASCAVPGSGLMRTFPTSIIMPHHWQKVRSSWQANRILDESTPRNALVQVTEVMAKGGLAGVGEKQATLAADASTKANAYRGMKIRVDGDGGPQVRKIVEYDAATREAELDAAWERIPADGSSYEILASREDEVLVAFQQGKGAGRNISARTPVRGRSQAVGDNSITLAADSSAVDEIYRGLRLEIAGGQAAGVERQIVSYDGAHKRAVLDEPWDDKQRPGDRSAYIIHPQPGRSRLIFWIDDTVEGMAQGGGEQTITLGPTAGAGNDVYADQIIEITGGPGQGQQRLIVDYNGAAKVATVKSPWETMPAAGSRYRITMSSERLAKVEEETSGQVQGAAESRVALDDAASHRDNVYNGMELRMVSGPGQGQVRTISQYDGQTKTATVDSPWAEGQLPAKGSAYLIVPRPLVPWGAWWPALKLWVPVILTIWICLIGLSLVVHRQWSTHEHLPYPIAEFANSLLPGADGALSRVLRDSRFWIAFGLVLALYLNNYFVTWFQGAWIEIPRKIDFSPIFAQFDMFRGGWFFYQPTVYFTVVAFAYFLSKDVSLSCGIGPILFLVTVNLLASQYGIAMGGGGYFEVNHQKFLIFGAYAGMTCILLYTGRAFYLAVAKRAVGLSSKQDLPGSSVWGARVAALAFIAFVAVVSFPQRMGGLGLDWQLGVLYGLGVILLFTVMARIIAETGLFFIQTYWVPCGIIVGIFGTRALGPETMLLLFLLSTVLLVDPREALMPFMINALKIVELRKQKLGRTAGWCTLALVIGLGVALWVTITLQYKHGAPSADGWAMKNVPTHAFTETIRQKQLLTARGLLAESRNIDGFARFAEIKPNNPWFLVSLSVGFLLVVGFSIGRLRFPNWPLHPVMFLIWAAYPAKVFAFSFLLGWLVKVLVTRFGGSRVYQQLKPLMFGLIAGELLGALIPILVGFVYYFVTGENPEGFHVFPG